MSGYLNLKAKLGLREVRDRDKLQSWFKSQGIICNPQTTPWCAAAVHTAEREAGNKTSGNLMARSFLKYGKKVDLKDAVEGDIVIFARGSNGYSGHVGYFVKQVDSDTILVLGGNQADMVCLQHYSTDRLLGVRCPD